MPIEEVNLYYSVKNKILRLFFLYLAQTEIYIQKMLTKDNFAKDYKLKPMYN